MTLMQCSSLRISYDESMRSTRGTFGKWRFGAIGMVLGLLAAVQALSQARPAAPADNSRLLNAINTVRQQGCEGQPAKVAVLRESAALSAVAARVAGGAKLDDAFKAQGYRSLHAAQITLRSASTAPLPTARNLKNTCSSAMHPDLSEAGFHQRGAYTWIVVARPFIAPPATQADEVQMRILSLVNEARARPRRCGTASFAPVPPLRPSAVLQSVAAGHAADMARHAYFSHTSRDGSTPDVRATRGGYAWRAVGENIAAGDMQADIAVQGWLNSPSHCSTIMAPQFNEMGVAFAPGASSNSAGIYWVQVFGSPR